jgi:hypothetical protein
LFFGGSRAQICAVISFDKLTMFSVPPGLVPGQNQLDHSIQSRKRKPDGVMRGDGKRFGQGRRCGQPTFRDMVVKTGMRWILNDAPRVRAERSAVDNLDAAPIERMSGQNYIALF